MADNPAEKGMAIRSQLWGEKRAREGNEFLSQFDADFAKFLNEELFGKIWQRPGLPAKTRSLLTMGALMVLGRAPELRLHMRGALNLGITAAEIKEVIIHLAAYGGVPTAVEAIRAFNEVTAPAK
ncbi:MAG: carboxymuconolactone decarboxylase family protein [Candidatus Binataceae bacterium]